MAARMAGHLAVVTAIQPLWLVAKSIIIQDRGIQFFLDKLVHHLRQREIQTLANGHQVDHQYYQDESSVPQCQPEPQGLTERPKPFESHSRVPGWSGSPRPRSHGLVYCAVD